MSASPANKTKRRSPNAGTLLGHRLRRQHNIVLELGECVVVAGSLPRLTFPPKSKDGQINEEVSLQPIHTPDLLIYFNNDLI